MLLSYTNTRTVYLFILVLKMRLCLALYTAILYTIIQYCIYMYCTINIISYVSLIYNL